jgi:hypothetical protein
MAKTIAGRLLVGLLLAILLSTCGGEPAVGDGGVDSAFAGLDLGNSPLCPKQGPGGGADGSASCANPGLLCRYGCEEACTCVSPELVWICCGGQLRDCPSMQPTEGSLCGCVPRCYYTCNALPMTMRCQCAQYHWTCVSVGCNGDFDSGGAVDLGVDAADLATG